MHSYYRLFADNLRQFNLKSLSSEFSQYKKFQAVSMSKSVNVLLKSGLSLFSSEEQLYNLEYKKYYPFLVNDLAAKKSFHIANSGNSKFNNFHQVLMNYSSLPTLLHYEDRNSMAHSIESRVPFLDHRIVDFLFKSPENIKIHDGYTKWILREAMKNRLPQKIKERKDKKGFVTPGEIVWLRGPLKELLEIDYSVLPFIDKKVTENLITDFKRGNNKNANLIWRVANLHYWIKTLKN
jgi:asparagine synthase (glutamine-hydrolysing)